MIEVEAANEVLVRLAVARVLRDDEPRHGFEQLAFAQEGTPANVGEAERNTPPAT